MNRRPNFYNNGFSNKNPSLLLNDDLYKIIDVFIEESPHLVLLDINLPKYDGYYWCRKIRQISTNPIILISARDSKMDQVMGIESGADDYITKHFYYDVDILLIEAYIKKLVIHHLYLLLFPIKEISLR